MEEECQKSEKLSYMAKLRREVVWCAEQKGNCKGAAIFWSYQRVRGITKEIHWTKERTIS
jgi:hypothetical protein